MTSFRCAMVLSVIWSTSVAAVEWMELTCPLGAAITL